MSEKPLFIPLKTEYYEAFESGSKSRELRRGSDKRWSEKNCRIGRHVTLSKGYGKAHRISGVVTGYERKLAALLPSNDYDAFRACFGLGEEFASVIHIDIDRN